MFVVASVMHEFTAICKDKPQQNELCSCLMSQNVTQGNHSSVSSVIAPKTQEIKLQRLFFVFTSINCHRPSEKFLPNDKSLVECPLTCFCLPLF